MTRFSNFFDIVKIIVINGAVLPTSVLLQEIRNLENFRNLVIISRNLAITSET